MRHWTKRLFAIAAPLLLTSCLWGPGKFNSELTLRKDGTFALDYRGEIVLQIPENGAVKPADAWKPERAKCYADGRTELVIPGLENLKTVDVNSGVTKTDKTRPCTASEIAKLKTEYQKQQSDLAERNRKQAEEAAKMFGLPGLDDASNRAFASKLMKYAGWRSVTYRGNGVFDVDYHFVGSDRQDFVFPALPDNDLLLPFIAIRRRADGSVLVTAPSFTGGAGPLMERMAAAGAPGDTKTDMVSHAQGRFTVITDGEILTNNSEDGPAPHPIGRQLHWDVDSTSKKIPETLIRL
jgi:hypothetical protein